MKDRINLKGDAVKGKLYVAGFGFLIGLTVFLRFFMLGRVPSGIFIDEAGTGYDAWCIANFGVDRFWYRFPVYFVNFGQGQNALYTYLYAFVLKIIGGTPSTFTLRLPAAVLGVFMTVCAMKLGRWSMGRKGCLLAGLLTAVCPIYIMSSRWALESYLLYVLCTFSVTCLVLAISLELGWKKDITFLAAGILFALTLYTYAVSYIILPFFFLFAMIYLFYIKQISLKHVLLMGIPMVIGAVPLLILLWINYAGEESIATRFFTIPYLPEYRGGEITLSHFLMSPIPMLKSMFFNDYLGYSAYDGFYTLYVLSIPFAVIGFLVCLRKSVYAVRKKRFDIQMLIFCFFIAVVLMGRFINGEWANVNQINAVFFPLWFFTVDGILWVGEKLKNILWRRLYYIVIVVGYMVCLIFFLSTYLFKAPTRFQPIYEEGWKFIEEEQLDYNECYADYGVQKIFYLFTVAPNPYEEPFDLNHQEAHGAVNCYVNEYTQIAPENVYIVGWENEEWMEKLDTSDLCFEKKDFDGYSVFYKS